MLRLIASCNHVNSAGTRAGQTLCTQACWQRPCATAPPALHYPAAVASTLAPGTPAVSYLELPDRRLAYIRTPGPPAAQDALGILFCPGLMSDMQGRKPIALAAHAAAQGHSCLCFDYRGHGQSSGKFIDSHLGMWVDDALQVLDQLVGSKVVIVGSSMGGWIGLHLALQRPERVAALLLIAPAVDFTRTRWQKLPQEARDALQAGGTASLGSRYAEPGQDVVRVAFFEEAERLCLMGEPVAATQAGSIGVHCPVRILHGMLDDVVLPSSSQALVPALASEDVHLTLVKGGNHRLSRDQDLELMLNTLDALLQQEGC